MMTSRDDSSVDRHGRWAMSPHDVIAEADWSFAADTSSVGHARDMVADFFSRHQLAELAEDVRLLVSELATNAVVHATTSFRLSACIAKTIARVEVTDLDLAAPSVRTPAPGDFGGRGLLIVEAVATRWGVEPLPDTDGKIVWFEFDR
jgi:anti-sigma regulatory factor (Ser/Thr protein kinase)